MNFTFVRQSVNIEIKNIDSEVGDSRHYLKHGILFPNSIRCLVLGESGVGKTNLIIGLITDKNGLKFKNLYIYSKSLEQPKYKFLEKLFSGIEEIDFFTFPSSSSLISLEEIKPFSLLILDDVIGENQKAIQTFFARSRHKDLDIFYLSQSYAKIPKHLIRENSNVLIIFRQDQLSLLHIFQDHVSPDMTFNQFCEMCRLCWRDKHDFVMIVKDFELNKGRYRKGFDTFITIQSEK